MSGPDHTQSKIIDASERRTMTAQEADRAGSQQTQLGQSSQGKDPSETPQTQAFLVVISELCFVALPFIVYSIILGYLGRLTKLFTLSEWAFAAVLLLGQSLAKFFTLLMSGRKPKITGKPLVVFVFTLVFGLIPSVIVLILMLLGSEAGAQAQPPSDRWFPDWLTMWQVGFFFLSVLVYVLLVGAYEYESSKTDNRERNPVEPYVLPPAINPKPENPVT